MNNSLTNQENTENKNTPQFTWEAPVLYTEEWMNTLVGELPGVEGQSSEFTPS